MTTRSIANKRCCVSRFNRLRITYSDSVTGKVYLNDWARWAGPLTPAYWQWVSYPQSLNDAMRYHDTLTTMPLYVTESNDV